VEPFAYGDLVQLGFLLRAVDVGARATSPIREGLEEVLRGKRQGLLWPYHSGTLVTCIDSALVLQGFRDPAGVEALEIFADGRGGYFPQICSEEPGNMAITPGNRHWCQPEYGTTCLVTALRAQTGRLARQAHARGKARAPSLDRGRRTSRLFVHRRAPYDKHGPRGALPYPTRSSRRP